MDWIHDVELDYCLFFIIAMNDSIIVSCYNISRLSLSAETEHTCSNATGGVLPNTTGAGFVYAYTKYNSQPPFQKHSWKQEPCVTA